ncbi:hypothetical protein SK128_024307, partial [Halocaridina rubra]
EENTEDILPIQKEDLLRDVLYIVDCLLGKGHFWSVTKNTFNLGSTRKSQNAPVTRVTHEEVTDLLEKAFSTEQEAILRLREEARQRKPTEFRLRLTVLEAEIQHQTDTRDPLNCYVRLKVGPKFFEEYETPKLMGTRYPKWKYDMNITLYDFLDEYLIFELWNEETEIKKKKHLISLQPSQEPSIKHVLLGKLSLPVKDTLEFDLCGWYKLQTQCDSFEKVRLHLSSELFCVSEVNENSQEAFDRLLKCLVDHMIKEQAGATKQRNVSCSSWAENVPASVMATIAQHALVLNLNHASQLLSWWNVISSMASHSDWILVLKQFDILKVSLFKGQYATSQKQYFSASFSKIIDNCLANLMHLERCFPVAHWSHSKLQLNAMLRIMRSMQDNPKISALLNEGASYSLESVIRAGLLGFIQHWWNKAVDLMKFCSSKKKDDQLQLIHTVIKEVSKLLSAASEFYEEIFYREVKICCVKVVYPTIIENMLAAVEPVITSCCSAIPASQQLIGDEGIECDFLKGSYLMKIYHNLFGIARVRCSHISKSLVSDTGIEDFYKMFEAGFWHQLALTSDRELSLIEEITEKDTLESITVRDHFSTSLLEAKAVAHRLKIWWLELSCPNIADRIIYMKGLFRKLICLSLTYCEKMYQKKDVIFEGSAASSKEIVNEKVCVAMINIEFMMQEIYKLPDIFGYNIVKDKIDEMHSKEISGMIENATKNAQTFLDRFIVVIIDRRRDFLEQQIIKSCADEDSSSFLEDVLHPTLDLLLQMLNMSAVQKVLQYLWETLVGIARNIVANDPQRIPSFYGELQKLLKEIVSDFTPESGEALELQSAQTPEYTLLLDDLQLMERDSCALTTLYYQERLVEQNDESSPQSALLVVRVWLQENTYVMVHVLMVKDVVVPPEEQQNAPLDYYITIQILPDTTSQRPISSTQIVKEDPATFDKEFEINIEEIRDNIKSGVMVLILRDHNMTRSDTFLGEAVVLLATIPSDISEAQNMYLKMTRPLFTAGCRNILHVLSLRKSDKEATAFIKLLKKRYSVKSFVKELSDEVNGEDIVEQFHLVYACWRN